MSDLVYFAGLLLMALGVIFGVAAVSSGDAFAWFVSFALLFVGGVLLTRARREQMRR